MIKNMNYDPNLVSHRIKECRKCNGFTQVELSSRSGISINSIKNYESARRIPDNFNVNQLAKALNVSPLYLLGETEYKNIVDKWNKCIDVAGLQKEVIFWETGIEMGLFPEFQSEDDFKKFLEYLKKYEERKE